MTPAEEKFKFVVHGLVGVGVYPSPQKIRNKMWHLNLGRSWGGGGQRNNLSGRECRWREEVLESLGWTHARTGPGARAWDPPLGWVEGGLD